MQQILPMGSDVRRHVHVVGRPYMFERDLTGGELLVTDLAGKLALVQPLVNSQLLRQANRLLRRGDNIFVVKFKCRHVRTVADVLAHVHR